MKITEDVRKYAAEQGLSEQTAIAEGLRAKSAEFKESGGDLYVKPV
jgi:phosphomethylpyrimidine synthase